MDKYEYKVRAEEIKNLIAQGEYGQAAEIADTIDWRRVKSVMMLCTISDLYKVNRRYEDARDMLLLAYEHRPGGRNICYALCELYLKTGEIVQAVEYYKEFVQVAPRDPGRYILLYKIYEVQEVSLEERIEVLEELKKYDYREKWAYELAYLYHRVGLETRCVEECDEMILWFGEGSYVIKAMELKMLHQPLSEEQQEKYDHRFDSKQPAGEIPADPEMESVKEELAESTGPDADFAESDYDEALLEGDTQVYEPVKSFETTVSVELTPEESGRGQEPEELDIQVKTVDVGIYNTINLQAELAEGLKEVLDSDTITRSIVAPMLEEENSAEIDEEFIEEPKAETAEELGAEPEAETAERFDVEPEAETAEELRAEPETAEEAPAQEGGAAANVEPPKEMANVLSQESDGQISLVLPERGLVEKQITGQMSIEDIMTEWERIKKENQEKREEEVRQHVLQQTGNMFTEFEASVRDGLLEQLEKSSDDDSDEVEELEELEELEDITESAETVEPKKVEAAVDDTVNAEAQTAPEPEPETEPEMKAEAQTASKTEPETEPEMNAEAQTAPEPEPETEPEMNAEAETAPEPEPETEPEMNAEAETAPEPEPETEPEMKAEAQTAPEPEPETEPEKSDSEVKEKVRPLTDEEMTLYAPYIQSESTTEQIIKALDGISLAAYTGNVIITGEEGMDTLTLAKNMIHEAQSNDSNLSGKIAKISGHALNKKNVEETLNLLQNGALIIQKAGAMEEKTVHALYKALQRENLGIIVIMEDKKKSMNKLLEAYEQLLSIFTARVDVEAMSNDELVAFGKQYAYDNEYSIDDLGVLALHTRIEELQTIDHAVTAPEVRTMVDDAIHHANRKTPRHFFDILLAKRYDEEDMIVLTERDFA